MSERAQALAEQFEQANNEAIATVEGCSDEQWRRHVESENRSVGVVMHHVAIAHPVIAAWVTAAARGQDVGVERGRIDQFNAQHAREQAITTRRTHALVVDPAAHRLTIMAGEDVTATRTLPADVMIEAFPPPALTVRFEPYGVSNGGDFRVQSGPVRYRVVVDGLTGRVKVDRE